MCVQLAAGQLVYVYRRRERRHDHRRLAPARGEPLHSRDRAERCTRTGECDHVRDGRDDLPGQRGGLLRARSARRERADLRPRRRRRRKLDRLRHAHHDGDRHARVRRPRRGGPLRQPLSGRGGDEGNRRRGVRPDVPPLSRGGGGALPPLLRRPALERHGDERGRAERLDRPGTGQRRVEQLLRRKPPGPSPSTDIDLYPFTATAGQLLFLAVDGDPGYDGTAVNTALALLGLERRRARAGERSGRVLEPQTPPPGCRRLANHPQLSARAAEALTYRVTTTGTYYASVAIGTDQPDSTGSGTYLLSISKNCTAGGGGLSADVSISQSDVPDPVAAGALVNYTITVSNAGPVGRLRRHGQRRPASEQVDLRLDRRGRARKAPRACRHARSGLVPSGALGPVSDRRPREVRASGAGSAVNTATVSSSTSDPSAANNSAGATTTITDPGTCDDGNSCTAGDHCSAGSCVGTPVDARRSDEPPDPGQHDDPDLERRPPASTSSDVLRGRVGQLPMSEAPLPRARPDRTFTTSACPSGSPVSDDFRTGVLNTGLWSLRQPARRRFDHPHDRRDGQSSPTSSCPRARRTMSGRAETQAIRLMQTISNLDFEIEVKWTTAPVRRTAAAGRDRRGQPGQLPSLRHLPRRFVEPRASPPRFVSNSPTVQANTALPGLTAPLWMRIKRTGNTWMESYSTNGTSVHADRHLQPHARRHASSGLCAGNVGSDRRRPSLRRSTTSSTLPCRSFPKTARGRAGAG